LGTEGEALLCKEHSQRLHPSSLVERSRACIYVCCVLPRTIC